MAEEIVKPVSLSPISAAKPPVSNPMDSAVSEHAATLKLKPVIRKPTLGGGAPIAAGIKLPSAPKGIAPAAAAPEQPAAMEQLKTVTQKLKGVTQQIPQQAILHKTGIISDQAMTDAQKQAAKARTARISLSDAMGVAPVKNEAAPMKTIRIKRPNDIQNPTAPAPLAPAAAPEPPTAATADESTVTQRKTLKVSRPGASASKFGLKKPGAPAAKHEPAASDAASADVPEIADIPDMPAMTPVAASPANTVADVPVAVGILGLIVQIAACAAMGVLGWWLYQDTQVLPF